MKPLNVDLDEISKGYFKASPTLTEEEQYINLEVYRLLSKGDPVTHEAVAQSLNMSFERVDEIIKSWPGEYYNDENKIIGFWGLAIPEMAHRFNVDGIQMYTWCAWDSLFIPELIQKTAYVESPDPITKEIIKFTVSPDGMTDLSPSEAVMSYVKPEYTVFDDNVINNFCHYVLFFASQKSGEEWTSTRDKAALMSMDDAFELAKRKNRFQYPSVLTTEKSNKL